MGHGRPRARGCKSRALGELCSWGLRLGCARYQLVALFGLLRRSLPLGLGPRGRLAEELSHHLRAGRRGRRGILGPDLLGRLPRTATVFTSHVVEVAVISLQIWASFSPERLPRGVAPRGPPGGVGLTLLLLLILLLLLRAGPATAPTSLVVAASSAAFTRTGRERKVSGRPFGLVAAQQPDDDFGPSAF